MDAAQALADLTEISSQIESAVLYTAEGDVLGSTLDDGEAAVALVRGAAELLEAAGSLRSEGGRVSQLEASTPDGSVFVVREEGRGIVATTAAQPTVGLVFYDLKSCLRSAAEAEPKPKPRRRRAAEKKPEEDGSSEA
jgi:predicted regulator of Ras-like GTPase activity (Roadblock/LC7/MglB family)